VLATVDKATGQPVDQARPARVRRSSPPSGASGRSHHLCLRGMQLPVFLSAIIHTQGADYPVPHQTPRQTD